VPLDLNLVRELASANGGLAIVSATRADASIHSSLVNAGVIDHPAGGPGVATVVRGDARKLALWRARPNATATFSHRWQWVSVEGVVTIFGPDDVAHEDLPGLLRSVFVAAGGSHDNWAEYDRVMAEERRTAIFITPERITTNG
jgi:PPOX class probable F420-dependent enzyme